MLLWADLPSIGSGSAATPSTLLPFLKIAEELHCSYEALSRNLWFRGRSHAKGTGAMLRGAWLLSCAILAFNLRAKSKIWADYKKCLHLKLRDEGLNFRGTTLIDMLFRLSPFRLPPDFVRARKITCPLKGFCSRVRHLNPYTVLHQPTARWNTFIKFIPFIASVLICFIR